MSQGNWQAHSGNQTEGQVSRIATDGQVGRKTTDGQSRAGKPADRQEEKEKEK
jgi:hypothetical protein